MSFGDSVCIPKCETLGVLNSVHLSEFTVGANVPQPLKQSSLIVNCRGALKLTINQADLNAFQWLVFIYSILDFMFVLLILLS